MRQGLAAFRATGGQSGVTVFLAALAETVANTGQVDDGLSMVADALTLVEHTGERFWGAELYRLRGDLLLLQKRSRASEREAEACLQRALAIARHRQAKLWELRAAMSLARLWQRQGKRKAAHRLLADIYHWFTEGFDTPDLQDARVLLEALT